MEVTCASTDDRSGHLVVRERGNVGRARRLCRRLAEGQGASVELSERAALVATELATNLVAHARGGEMHVRASADEVEIVSLDRGDGLGDPEKAFRDGYSTAGTGGTGLGAVRRLSRELDFDTGPHGTVLVCRLTSVDRTPPMRRAAGLVAPYPGEPRAGDGLLIGRERGRLVAILVDGLGHGELASSEQMTALEAAAAAPDGLDPVGILARIHEVMSKAGGAAASVAVIDPRAGELSFAGIGNVAGRLLHPDGRASSLVTVGGIVGRDPFRARAQPHPWQPGSVLVMHSDGVTARWQPKDYPWARRRDPALLAGVLMRDFRRARDDASVLVLRGAA